MKLRLAFDPGSWLKSGLAVGAAAMLLALAAGAVGGTEEIRSRLDKGEVIVSAKEEPGSSLKRARMEAIIEAPPEIVWQIITDVNAFKFFMPRTLTSMAVAPGKIPVIVAKNPTQAAEVEKMLGPVPANPADYRIPGGKYAIYHYSNLSFPWPCNNRWYIVKGMHDETQAAQHAYRLNWSLIIGNLKENSGEWLLEPYGQGQTKATYHLNTDPGGAIPDFLIKQGTCTTMPQIIQAVRERAAKICMLKKSQGG